MESEETKAEEDSLLPIDEHEEFVSEGGRQIRRRGIFLLPNLLTLGALFAGFYAVIAGMAGNFNEAGWAILIAGICDGLDGRIARLTGTQSAFGAQFDSLSDMVSFGVAPALIMFSWALDGLGNVGWAASFVYMSCAALRLARFNVQLGTVDKRFFLGLQSPVSAGLITFVPWVAAKYGVEVTPLISWLAALITVFAGLLMVSNYKYYSFKELQFNGTVPYIVFFLTVVLLVVIAQNPHEVLLSMCVIYAISGPMAWVYRRQFKRNRSTNPVLQMPDQTVPQPETGKQPGRKKFRARQHAKAATDTQEAYESATEPASGLDSGTETSTEPEQG